MSVDVGVYAGISDLRYGDIPLPSYMGDGSSYINSAAEQIDSQIGHLYVTPVVWNPETPENRPSRLMLKRINWLIASGRLVLDLAAAGESDSLNAFGMGMLKEGMELLKCLVEGEFKLLDAPPIDPEEKNFTGPVIYNEDNVSLVQSFYDRANPYQTLRFPYVQPRAPEPYGNKHEVEVVDS